MSNGIFLRPDNKASYTEKNGVINLNLTESLAINLTGGTYKMDNYPAKDKHMVGGVMNDNLIHLEFSEDTPLALKGGKNKEDSTEYFDRIASKITSKLSGGSKSQLKGGFMGSANVTDTDDFLTSETINNLNLVGGKQGKSETFNFNAFKTHLARATAKTDDFGIDEDDEDDEDDLFGDTDDEDKDEDEDDEDENGDPIIRALENSVKNGNKGNTFTDFSTKRANRNIGTLKDPSDSSESLSLSDNDNDDYELSASAESPKLMAYRKVGQGRRFL